MRGAELLRGPLPCMRCSKLDMGWPTGHCRREANCQKLPSRISAAGRIDIPLTFKNQMYKRLQSLRWQFRVRQYFTLSIEQERFPGVFRTAPRKPHFRGGSAYFQREKQEEKVCCVATTSIRAAGVWQLCWRSRRVHCVNKNGLIPTEFRGE